MENRTNKSTQISESVFSRFSAWVVTKLRDGIFGRFFTSYDSTDKKFKAGIKNLKKNNTQKRTKRTIARAIETNPIVNSVPKIHQFLSRVAIRDYGVVLMTMAIISTALFFVQNYVPVLRWSLSSLVTGIVIAVFSIPMLFSKRTIASLLFEGRLCNSFLFGYLGMSDEVYRYASDDTSHSSPSIALLAGMVLSVLAYFPGLLLALAIILIVFLAYNVLITPEVGVILIILSMPFTNVSVMTGIGLYVAICYIIKCVTGRRTFKLEFMDLWMLIISLVIIYGGFVTFDFGSSIMHMLSMLALLSTFFVASNLVRSKEWFRRCIISFCISSTIASALGILQFVFGKLNIVWDGMKEFSTIHERAVSSFDSSTSFALYLVSAIPFLLLFIFSGKTSKARAIGLTCSLINIVALVLTYSKVGYIGAIAMLIFLLIIFHRNTAYLVLFGATVAIVLNYALPKELLDMLSDIVASPENAHEYRLYLFNSSIEILKARPFGVGLGEAAFEKAFAQIVGEGTVQNAGNLYLNLAISCGIMGLVLFLCAIVVMLRLVFSYCAKTENRSHRINALAGFAGAFGVLVSGLYTHSFSDKTIFAMTILCLALTYAYIKMDREVYDALKINHMGDYLTASIDIELDKDAAREYIPTRKYVHSPKRKKTTEVSHDKALDGIKSNEIDPVFNDD